MKKIFYKPIFLVLLTVVVFLIIAVLNKRTKKPQYLAVNLNNMRIKLESIKKDTQQKEQLLEKAQEPLVFERLVRTELLMQKDNEIVIKLDNLPVPESEIEQQPDSTPFEQWLEVFAQPNLIQ